MLQITGGAHGIGRAIAIELAKYGCNIAVADVDMKGALETVEELHLLGVKAFPYEVIIHNMVLQWHIQTGKTKDVIYSRRFSG